MKIHGFIILFGLVAAALGQQAGENELACDCPSCREKAASGKEFTLPALRALEDEVAEQDALPAHDHAETGHDHGSVEDHDHDADTGLSCGTAEVCCPHDEPPAPEDAPHSHAGDGVLHHASHDEQESAEHDSHAAHVLGSDDGNHHGVDEIELSADMIQKAGIQVHVAKGGVIARASVFPAEIKLNRDRTAAVSPRYSSIVRQVFAEIGDRVRKGDVLALLENRETLAVYSVSAPLDGVVISKNLSVGESADVERVLFEVADLSSVWADISIFPQYQHLLQKGMSVKFIAHDGHSTEGTVKYISPIVSHETRTFTARCVLEGASEDFTPGAFVRARIHTETANVPVVIRRDAVQMLEGVPVLFVPGTHGFKVLEVELGLADDDNVEIRSGLEPGDRYVAVGAFALKAQMVTSGMDPHAGHGH
jgi:cobalt-zinc-cadmium efflux system membrane fusion protein